MPKTERTLLLVAAAFVGYLLLTRRGIAGAGAYTDSYNLRTGPAWPTETAYTYYPAGGLNMPADEYQWGLYHTPIDSVTGLPLSPEQLLINIRQSGQAGGFI